MKSISKKKRKVACDAEFNGLDNPDICWVIVCKDLDTKDVFTFSGDDLYDGTFSKFADNVSIWYGANFLSYDAPQLRRLGIYNINDKRIIDLQIVSRLVYYERRIFGKHKSGPHSVENFAQQFGMVKPPITDYNNASMINEYIHRCQEDVEITYKMWDYFHKYIEDPDWSVSMRCEHDTVAEVCNKLTLNGFAFNKNRALKFRKEIVEKLEDLTNEIVAGVGPVFTKCKTYKLSVKKDGSLTSKTFDLIGHHKNVSFSDGCEYSVPIYEDFKPNSPKQKVEYLNKCGWKPYEKTDGHLDCERELNQKRRWGGSKKVIKELEAKLSDYRVSGWKVNEANLETLPKDAPSAAQKLAEWATLNNRLARIDEWLDAYNDATGAIHGKYWHIGAWTHRKSHQGPNQANIYGSFHTKKSWEDLTPVERVKATYDNELRALFEARKGHLLVGTDAEGIQLRILAHYMKDKAYADAVAYGDKDKGTDVHNVNLRALELNHLVRDDAKTFIYAWLLGAGTGKVSSILKCSSSTAVGTVARFLENLPALNEVKTSVIPSDARNGYFVGLDGRKVACNSEHLMLAGYLQNGESVIMKHANLRWIREATTEGLPFKQVNDVHDEWQTECRIVSPLIVDDTNKGRPYTAEAKRLGEIQRDAIVWAGEQFGCFCPLAGSTDIGVNWYETH